MGGNGSSRWRWYSKRICAEDCRVLDVNLLRRDGFLRSGVAGTVTWPDGGKIDVVEVRLAGDVAFIRLAYSITWAGQRQNFGYRVDLVQVPRLVDKHSWVFRCPLQGCDRRAVKLYLPPGGRYFGCRHCYDLTYRKRQQHDKGLDPYLRLSFDELISLLDQLQAAPLQAQTAREALKVLDALDQVALRQIGTK